MTWDELVELEPDLAVLAADIASEPALCGHCSVHAWYGWGDKGFKSRMLSLVGFMRVYPDQNAFDDPPRPRGMSHHALTMRELIAIGNAQEQHLATWLSTLPEADADRERVLRTSDAYDTTYQHLFDLIPVLPAGARCAGCDRDSVG